MGRYDFRALRVHQTATQLLETKTLKHPPPWYDIIGTYPPASSQTLVRPVLRTKLSKKKGKPSRMFIPVDIHYEEDKLRQDFFGDHPWELARPRIVLENDGKDAQRFDWSRIEQPGKLLDGESVVQRQMYLMRHEKLSKPAAYDKARREFYKLRHEQDLERRVALEEALSTGAYFGKSANEIGMELEDRAFEGWKEWAQKEAAVQRQAQEAMYTGGPSDDEDALEEPMIEVEEEQDERPEAGQSDNPPI